MKKLLFFLSLGVSFLASAQESIQVKLYNPICTAVAQKDQIVLKDGTIVKVGEKLGDSLLCQKDIIISIISSVINLVLNDFKAGIYNGSHIPDQIIFNNILKNLNRIGYSTIVDEFSRIIVGQYAYGPIFYRHTYEYDITKIA